MALLLPSQDPYCFTHFLSNLEGSPWDSAQTFLKHPLPSLFVACHTKRQGKTVRKGWEKSNVSGVSEVCDSFGALGWVFKCYRLLTAKWNLSKGCVHVVVFFFFFFRMHSLYQVESFVAHSCMCVCVILLIINYLRHTRIVSQTHSRNRQIRPWNTIHSWPVIVHCSLTLSWFLEATNPCWNIQWKQGDSCLYGFKLTGSSLNW